MTDIQSEIKRLYESGVRNIGIAKITDLTINQVNRIIYKELGLQSKNRITTVSEIKKVKVMRDSGMKLKEIGDILGCSFNRVKYLLEAS